MKKILFGISALLLICVSAQAQLKVGSNPTQIVSGAKLQVDGNATTSTPASLIVNSAGNVGIGTANPTSSLTIGNLATSAATETTYGVVTNAVGDIKKSGALEARYVFTLANGASNSNILALPQTNSGATPSTPFTYGACEVTVVTTNSCAYTFYSKFFVGGSDRNGTWSCMAINAGFVAANSVYGQSATQTNQNTVTISYGAPGCGDGSSNNLALFSISSNGGILSLSNTSGASKTFIVTVKQLN